MLCLIPFFTFKRLNIFILKGQIIFIFNILLYIVNTTSNNLYIAFMNIISIYNNTYVFYSIFIQLVLIFLLLNIAKNIGVKKSAFLYLYSNCLFIFINENSDNNYIEFISLFALVVFSLISFTVIFNNTWKTKSFKIPNIINNIQLLFTKIYNTPIVYITVFILSAFIVRVFRLELLNLLYFYDTKFLSYIFTIFSLTIPTICLM